jgi:hypothetical protein
VFALWRDYNLSNLEWLVIIIIIAFFWYALIPLAGILIRRHTWRVFRERFVYLSRMPLLDYGMLRQNINGEYYFIGSFESITENSTLWIKTDNLTIPVFLKDAQTYMLPLSGHKHEGGADQKLYFDENDLDINAPALRRFNWNRISSLTAGAKVFIGGALKEINGRQTFASLKGQPLLVIFYECSETMLSVGVVRAGKYSMEYWNNVTPYSLIGGVFSLIAIAQFFYARPIYRVTVLSAIVAIFGPLFSLLPPGLIFTLIYRNLWMRACIYRVFRDVALLPMKYADHHNAPQSQSGAVYECRMLDALPDNSEIPRLLPASKPEKNESWHMAGFFGEDGTGEPLTSVSPNPFIPCGLLPGSPKTVSRKYNRKAVLIEVSAWLALIAGIALNVFFAELIIYLTP